MVSVNSDRPGNTRRPVEVPRKRSPLLVTAIAVGALVVAVIATANVWTEVVWYQHTGYWQVIRTEWVTRVALFAIFGVLAGVAVWLTLWLAKRARPLRSAKQTPLDQYRQQIQPLEKLIMIALPILVGIVAGGAMSGQWQTVLMWQHQVPFGTEDPVFGMDASFYLFTL